jgi:hypothetical protein
MVAEAIRNGTWPPSAPYAGPGIRAPRKSLGAKPKMFIANIGLVDEPSKPHGEGKQKEKQKQWPQEVESWNELVVRLSAVSILSRTDFHLMRWFLIARISNLYRSHWQGRYLTDDDSICRRRHQSST